MDILRQESMRVLAAEADARWASKPSFLVAPQSTGERAVEERVETAKEGVEVTDNVPTKKKKVEQNHSPWDKASKTQDEPTPWSPKTSQRR